MGEILKLFAFLLLLSKFLETVKSDQYIMGGKKPSENQFPFLTSLRVYRKWRFEHMCAASILSDRFLVTAAHCCPHFIKPHIYQIVVGAQTNESDGEIYLVEKFFVHPNYTAWPFEKVVNDIALIQLKEAITLDKNTSTIEISHKLFDANVDALVAGWGKNEEEYSGLKCAEIKTITNDECRKRAPPGSPVNDYTTICAHSTTEIVGLCWGDGGDPLVQINNSKLIGVASWTKSCQNDSPEGFTRISEFATWIDSILNKSHSDK